MTLVTGRKDRYLDDGADKLAYALFEAYVDGDGGCFASEFGDFACHRRDSAVGRVGVWREGNVLGRVTGGFCRYDDWVTTSADLRHVASAARHTNVVVFGQVNGNLPPDSAGGADYECDGFSHGESVPI